MSDFAYHMEAQRKARIIEKKNKAQYSNGNRQVSDCNQHGGGSASPQKYNTQRYTDRPALTKFHVSDEGFRNRYRGHANHHPDLAYSVIYPANENPAYTHEENRNNRRLNVQTDKYDMRRKVNGDFDMKVYLDTVVPASVK